MKTCDLHVHSTFSDGTYHPKEILRLAKDANLSAIALTDHNTVDGLDFFLKEGENSGIECITGVEISSEYKGKSIHIIGLFLKQKDFPLIKDFLKIPQKRKEESNELLAKRLNEKGYEIDYEQIKLQANGQINRVHFANALIAKGYVDSVEKACQTILSEDGGIYIPPKRLTAEEAIRFIRSVNAVPVLAHSLLDLDREELTEFLYEAKKCGLLAMETRYSKYDGEEETFSEKIAKEFGLLSSGGSDFHGENKPNIKLGVGEGSLCVPYAFVEKLKACNR